MANYIHANLTVNAVVDYLIRTAQRARACITKILVKIEILIELKYYQELY